MKINFYGVCLKNVGLKSVSSKSLYINGEEAEIDDLVDADVEILNNIGDKFDVLYHRLPPKMRREIYERTKDMDSMFDDLRLPRKRNRDFVDRQGYDLQANGLLLAKEAELIYMAAFEAEKRDPLTDTQFLEKTAMTMDLMMYPVY
jgi:hypothetical protein